MPSITIEGKSRIFFSTNASDKPWRLIERVVAVIESFFQGVDDLYVLSPQRIRNVVGDPVEVDAAYAHISDPTSVFEFVQIRDRQDAEGRPWVEQVLGQRTSTGIHAGVMVSTERFSDEAIRLAEKFNVQLRLLLNEAKEKIREWYSPDTIGLQGPMVDIQSCDILTKAEDRVVRFKADINKCSEDNILVATDRAYEYGVVSLQRVFDVDVMRSDSHREELLAKIPTDNQVHKAVIAIEYERPRLYLKASSPHQTEGNNNKEIQPISGLVFLVQAKHEFRNEPITHRYKYIDAINNACIAQAIVSHFDLPDGRHYVCLVRHHIAADHINLGGAFFS